MMEKGLIEHAVRNYCMGTNIGFWGSSDIGDEYYDGLEIILIDALEKGVDFESDVKALMDYLNKTLNANIMISDPHFYEETDIDDLDGESFTNYYCSIKFGVNK